MGCEIIKPEMHRPVRGVLFDMDGVVVDTEKLYARFWREAAIALGYPMTHEQALGMRSLNRQEGQKQLERYFGPGVSHPQVRMKRIELMEAYIQEHGVDPKPGVMELLTYLKARGIKTAITTSSPLERVQRYLKQLGFLDGFDELCTVYEVERGKPEPDIYLYGAASLGLKPEECLALEDSPAGLQSAFRAGCMPVLVPDQDPPNEATLPLAYAVADSLTDVIGLIEKLLCFDEE